MGFKSLADQISYTLPTTRHRCNFDVWALAQSREDGHRSLVTPEGVLSEYNEDLILSNCFKVTILAEICIKMRYFCSKVAKNAQRWELRPPYPLASSGGWVLLPRPPPKPSSHPLRNPD